MYVDIAVLRMGICITSICTISLYDRLHMILHIVQAHILTTKASVQALRNTGRHDRKAHHDINKCVCS